MSDSQSPSPAEVYETYMGPTIADPFTRILLGYARPKPGERVLDVACGTGTVARQIAPIVGADGMVVALDISEDMLRVGRTLSDAPIDWKLGDAAKLGFPDGAFDLVTCQQGLQFFAGRDASAREMRRVLVRGGRAVVSVWQSLRRHPVYEALFEAVARRLHAPLSALDVSFSLPEASELQAILMKADFQDIAVFPRSLTVQLPSADDFVRLTTMGAATSVAAFAELDDASRDTVINEVESEVLSRIRAYRDGNRLVFPMNTHIGVGFAR